jgi:uncharacterized DUF497 family protein
MRIDKDAAKEGKNIQRHKFDFSFATLIFTDPLAVTVYDRYENGEDRWHTFSIVAGILLLAVHTYPDPNDDQWVRIIGLRKATRHERTSYEQGSFE